MIGGSGFSSYSESRPRPILRSGPRENRPRYEQHLARHGACGWEGMADYFEAPGYSGFDCEGCGLHVPVFDDGTVDEDVVLVAEPHTDPDWLDGPPESATERGVA